MKKPGGEKPLFHVSLATPDGMQTRLKSGDVLVIEPKNQTMWVVREGQPLVWIHDFLGSRDDKRSFSLVRSREQATEFVSLLSAMLGIVMVYHPSNGDYRFKVV